MAREMQKAILYVLKLEDPTGGPVPPFYKIGITTDTVDKFKVDYPDVRSQFTTLGTTTRRATVKRSRDTRKEMI